MIITSEIAPSSELAPFVRCYSYMEFDTNGSDMIKPMHAVHEASIVFFFRDRPVQLVDWKTGEVIKTGTYCDVSGLSTHYMGKATFNGTYSFLEICFRSNGFNRVFGVPINVFTDHIIAAEDIFSVEIRYLFERLCAAENLNGRVHLIEVFLLNNLKKRKQNKCKDAIVLTSDLMLKSSKFISVAQLASYANMGVRNFERQFSEKIGMSPRLFCCVARFNHAFENKLQNPKKDWTSIAYECGYFDQMHLIKDFKRFTGSTPGSFLEQTPHAQQIYLSRVEH